MGDGVVQHLPSPWVMVLYNIVQHSPSPWVMGLYKNPWAPWVMGPMITPEKYVIYWLLEFNGFHE